jgi:hypothetical protein
MTTGMAPGFPGAAAAGADVAGAAVDDGAGWREQALPARSTTRTKQAAETILVTATPTRNADARVPQE